MEEKRVAVPVAYLWTTKDSARDMDALITSEYVSYEKWLMDLTYESRLELCTENLVQSQALFNETVLVVKEENGWAEVILPEQPTMKHRKGYPGWMPVKQLKQKKQDSRNLVRIMSNTAPLFTAEQEIWMQLSFGTVLPIKQEYEHMIEVETPLGKGFIKRTDVEARYREQTGEQLLNSARQFLGLPYLWGGMSGFGFDCSGFVYSIHKASGITIPRDASNQAKTGIVIERNKMLPGDLLYFAYDEGRGNIHHVAMYAGNNEIIHAPKTGRSVEQIQLDGTVYEKEHCSTKRFTSECLWRDLA